MLALLLATLGLLLRVAVYGYYRAAYPMKYSAYVEEASARFGVDRSLVYAVIKNESSFKPDAVSSVEARGLMQITKDTFEWAGFRMKDPRDVTFDDMFDPQMNIEYGTYILSLLLEEFGSPSTALCAYHAGWGNVKKWLANPEYSQDGRHVSSIPFKDTDGYVSRVLKTQKIYGDLYPGPRV